MRQLTLLAALALGAIPGPAPAQETRVPVLVEQIAGVDIYLRLGTDQGVAAGDTLLVFPARAGAAIGRLVVVAVSTARSVTEFAGDPFPVTRGTTLYVTLPRTGLPPAVAPEPVRAPARPSRQAPTPSLHGRLTLAANAFESTARWDDGAPQEATRRFAEPTATLRAAASDLPGGWSVHTSLRAAYRYSSPELVSPRGAVAVYRASVVQGTPTSAFYAELGRFFNPFVTSGAAWDGLVLRVGGRGFGVGAAAGYEPDRGDQAFSTARPKYGAFVTWGAGRGPVRYGGDLSIHQARPRDSLPVHTYAGWSQYLRVRRLRLAHDLQVDRDQERDRWVVTRLNGSASLPLAPGLELRARVSRAEPFAFWRTDQLFPFRRDQGSLGLAFWSPRVNGSADVAAHRSSGGDWGWTYSGALGLPRTAVLGLGWSAAGSYWTQGPTSGLHLASGLSRSVGAAVWRAGYQYDRWDAGVTPVVTHAADLSLSFPLARRTYADLRGRVQRGANLTTQGLFLGLWTAF